MASPRFSETLRAAIEVRERMVQRGREGERERGREGERERETHAEIDEAKDGARWSYQRDLPSENGGILVVRHSLDDGPRPVRWVR